MGDERGVRPGYGWAVGSLAIAFLSAFLGWLAIVMSHRIRKPSSDIVWQATLAVVMATAVVAFLLARGAWRRGGGVAVARLAAILAAGSFIASPIGVAIARPGTRYVRVSDYAAADGALRWTASPHLVGVQTVRARSAGTIEVGGDAPNGSCDTNPARAVLDARTGRTQSITTSTPGSFTPLATTGGVIAFGTGGAPPRAANASLDVTLTRQPSVNGSGEPLVVQATDSASGQIRWQVATNSGFGGPPLFPLWVDDRVVITASLATGNGFVAASSAPNPVTPTATKPLLQIGSGSTILALAASDGHELWRAHVGPAGQPVVAAAGPIGVAVATDSTLSLRDLQTGTVSATTPLSAGAINAVLGDLAGAPSNPIVVTTGTVALVTSASVLQTYDPALHPRWQHRLFVHHDRSALQLEAAGDALFVIDQVTDPTAGC